ERPDREPVAAERAACALVHCQHARLRREEGAARRRLGPERERQPHLAGAGLRPRHQATAPRPRAAGRAEHEPRRRALELGEAKPAQDGLDRPARRQTAQAEERSHEPVGRDRQLDLLRLLRDELQHLGLADAEIDEHGYVFATVPATTDAEVPTIGFLAHVDTSPDVSGANVKPQRIRYEGGEIVLPANPAQVIRPEDSPELAAHEGHDLITTDGTTLLGADDKAGAAEIMAA